MQAPFGTSEGVKAERLAFQIACLFRVATSRERTESVQTTRSACKPGRRLREGNCELWGAREKAAFTAAV